MGTTHDTHTHTQTTHTPVPRMLTAINMACDEKERQAMALVIRQEASCPWSWNPPRNCLHFAQHLDELPIPRRWTWNLSYFQALVSCIP